MSTIQDVVLGLTRFWVDQGCALLAAADQPVAAAVMHPQAFPLLFGAAPCRLVFAQSVRRPLDGRHGVQPYRLAKHLQVEVVLKPAPDDLLPRYLDSLRALGFQLEEHDVRFAEGRWRAPGLAAWGMGWNVRIDGLGVSRLTVLQEAGGAALAPVSAELVYGVERLATSLAGAAAVFDVPWTDAGPSYGDLRRQEEREMSRYAFEVAGIDQLSAALDAAAAEAERCLDAGLSVSGYEAALRASHTLDLLAARGALAADRKLAGVERVRSLIGRAAQAWQRGDAAEPEGDGDAG